MVVLLDDPSAPAVGLLALRARGHVEDEMRSLGLWGQLLEISAKFYPAGIIVKPDTPQI